jgi:diaminopimelate epimerase
MTFNNISAFNNILTHMIIPFNKYHGTGNDFVIIDNRKSIFNHANPNLIKKMCDRRFGIGADGFIIISSADAYDYEMLYYNSDGNKGSMCANGARCAAEFAYNEGIACNNQKFITFDGMHEAVVGNGTVRLKMNDVSDSKQIDGNYFIYTGSPHYVVFVNNVKEMDVLTVGKKLRWSEKFSPGGTNVDFAEIVGNGLFVRTFERGVENETFSCGTGVTASAIAAFLSGHSDKNTIPVSTRGGNLTVEFKVNKDKITDIWLSGPATFVYRGEIDVEIR